MPTSCAMRNCSTDKSSRLRSLHRFPSNPARCKAWIEACGNPDLYHYSIGYLNKNFHVCDLHFKMNDRVNRKLKMEAIPFPHNQIPKENSGTQTDPVMFCDSDSDVEVISGSSSTDKKKVPRKNNKLNIIKNRLRQLQAKEKGVRAELFTLIELQCEISKYGNDPINNQKLQIFALNLYLAFPKTYRTMRSSLNLPSEKVLRRTNLEIDAVMSSRLLLSLNFKVQSLTGIDKHCTVCLKKMSLKRFLFYHINRDKIIGIRNINGNEVLEPATHVYVLMATGIKCKWEQPLSYCFVDDHVNSADLNSWIDFVITKFIIIGYDVVALVVDHEDMYDHIRNRFSTLTRPFITTFQTKIYCIFDLPQLIISLRNTLMSHELQFPDDDGSMVTADWKILESLYSGNNDGYRCIVPKLTKSHIDPNDSEKKELKYAAQVFSKTVSDALEIESKRLTDSDSDKSRIRGTQKLAALVNDVFDILNSPATDHHYKSNKAFSGEPNQMATIRKFMELLTSVTPSQDCDIEDPSFNCVYGLRITLMSFTLILRDLWSKGIKSFKTHKFNLSALDKFFDHVKQTSTSKKPTPLHFYKCFRRTFMNEIMKCPGRVNKSDILSQFVESLKLKEISRQKLTSLELKKTLEVATTDYRFELPSSNSFHYVCWYLLKKCFEIHSRTSCHQLIKLLQEEVPQVDWATYTWHTYFKPPEVFISFVKMLDVRFNKNFGCKMEVGLGTGTLWMLQDTNTALICPCFPEKFARRLFVRLRIFHIIRYNNRRFSDNDFSFSKTDHYNIDIL